MSVLTSTPSVTYTFDQNGNTLTKVDSTGTTQYNWDIENRLTTVTLPAGAGTVSFKYDPFGRRIQKVTASGTTTYVYDGANFIAEYDASGALLAKYAQGAGIDEPLAISRGGQTGYYDADGLGSVTSVIDNTLTPLATYTYDAFGKKVTTGGSLINPFQYTGREWDQETGLYYYRARYYEPAVGRFISEDPSRGDYDDSKNLYLYVINDPTDNSDPTGLYVLQHGGKHPPLVPGEPLNGFLLCTEQCYGSILTITSTSEPTPVHQPGTPHRRGLAADIKMPANSKKLLCCAGKCGARFALDEAIHPSPHSTGAHIHLQMIPGKGGSRGDLPKRLPCTDCQ